METEYLRWIGGIGFPAAAFYLMYRLVTTTLTDVTKALGAMTLVLQELRDAMRMGNGWNAKAGLPPS